MTQKERAYTLNSDLGSNFHPLPTTTMWVLEHFTSLKLSLLIFMKVQWDRARKDLNPALAHSISSVLGNGHRGTEGFPVPPSPSASHSFH